MKPSALLTLGGRVKLWINHPGNLPDFLSTPCPLLATGFCTVLCDDACAACMHHSLNFRISLSQSSRNLPSASINVRI